VFFKKKIIQTIFFGQCSRLGQMRAHLENIVETGNQKN
jgi:hypothetical protein